MKEKESLNEEEKTFPGKSKKMLILQKWKKVAKNWVLNDYNQAAQKVVQKIIKVSRKRFNFFLLHSYYFRLNYEKL